MICCKGAAPSCLRKFGILRAKYAKFQALFELIQKYMISCGRKGAVLLYMYIRFWGLQRGRAPGLSKFVFCKLKYA